MSITKWDQNLQLTKKVTSDLDSIYDKKRSLREMETEVTQQFDAMKYQLSELAYLDLSVKDHEDLEELLNGYRIGERDFFQECEEAEHRLYQEENRLLAEQDQLYFERQELIHDEKNDGSGGRVING
ncbi:hypothetical protein [Streptococcus parauberis]|uniref:hypothetical protein n=1 Tax=Streptococcus parauberis TaxID=1348 RepID=UPI000CCEE3C2|nr:hypothetical protein [Streptococcus parauberis]PNY19785.1 hypothetical protein ASN86_00610 [Streptococcus parauberis]